MSGCNYSMLRNYASGPEIGLPGRILAWQKRDLSPLLRLDYDGLVTTLADILGDTIIETVDEIDESSA